MNKHFLYMGMAVAAMLTASCSNDDVTSGNTKKDQLASDEAISLAVSQVSNVTRAPLGDMIVDEAGNPVRDDQGYVQYKKTFDAEDLGFYCLASDKMNGTQDISWKDGNDNPNFVWFENRKADAVTKTIAGTETEYTDIVWKETPTEDNLYSYYYPLGSQYKYDFYGYYPYSDNVQKNSETYSVTYTDLDGTKDVIWGKADINADDADAQNFAYSAKYFRVKKDQDGEAYNKQNYLPNVNFKHKLMKFNIIIKKGTGETDGIENIGVKKVTLRNVCTEGTLVIASRDADNLEKVGTFTPDWTKVNEQGIELKDKNDQPLGDDNYLSDADANGRIIGQGFLIPVLPKQQDGTYVDNKFYGDNGEMANKGVFRLIVDFSQKNSTSVYKAAQYEIVPPAEGWKEGYEYDIVIAISTPLVIEANATLTPWEHGRIELE